MVAIPIMRTCLSADGSIHLDTTDTADHLLGVMTAWD